jgi:hypothetical protein
MGYGEYVDHGKARRIRRMAEQVANWVMVVLERAGRC